VLLVTFCMQLASPRQSGGLLDLEGDGYSWLPLDDMEFPDYANGGLSGVCRVAGDLVLATQSTPPLLILYDPIAGRVKARRDLSPCVDSHSVAYHEGLLYVCSTGTNEIYAVALSDEGLGEPRLHWRYPGVAYDRDLVHLNGVTVSAEGLVATCFGPREADGSWSSAGALFLVEPYQVIAEGLAQPHTPLACGDRLFCAESRGHRVHSLRRDGDGTWCAEPPIEVGGYARGLACRDSKLWVGISAPRRVSRSKGTRNDGVNAIAGAGVVCIDLATRTVIDRHGLDGLGEEVYDLLILDHPGPLGRRVDALTHRTASMLAMVDTIRADYTKTSMKLEEMMAVNAQIIQAHLEHIDSLAQALERERARAEGLAQALQAEQQALQTEQQALQIERQALQTEQIYSLRLAQELRTVTGSRLWRAAQLLRRLAGRAPYVPALERPATPAAAGAPPVYDAPPVPAAVPPIPAASPAAPNGASMAEVFRKIYVENVWGSEVSHSGTGSDLEQTAVIRETLLVLIRELGVRTMLDVPCGDFHWMQRVDLDVDYIGADVVVDLIEANQANFGSDRRRFQVVNIADDDLPRVDLVFCRDLLVHFSFADALRAIANLKRSGSTWLLTTTFTDRSDHCDIATGQWRAINLQIPPFNFPAPLRMINENCTEFGTDWADKSLGLWRLADL
jgi:hypothetical protein